MATIFLTPRKWSGFDSLPSRGGVQMTNLENFACDILLRAHSGIGLERIGQRTDGPGWSPATCKEIIQIGERHGIHLPSYALGKDDA